MSTNVIKLPKIDPATIRRAKEFLAKFSKEIVVVVTWLIDKLLGKEELKNKINSLNNALSEAKGIINDLVEQNEQMSIALNSQAETLRESQKKLKTLRRNLYLVSGIAAITIAILFAIILKR